MKVITKQQTWFKQAIMLILTFLLVISSALPAIGGPLKVQAADNTFYVSSDGNDDTHDGSESSPFATIEKAYEAITDNGTIVLLSDITLSKQLTLEDSKIVTIQSNDEKSIIRDENYKGILILVQGSADITFNDITIDGNEVAATNQGIYAKNGNVTFENTAIKNHTIAANGGVAAIFAYGTGIVKIGTGTKIFDNKVIGMNEGNPSAVLLAGTGGQLIIEGGDIYHNTIEGNSNGPIVGVGSSGSPSFTMTGGKIRDNYLSGNGENTTGKTVGNVAVYMRGTAAQAAFNFGGTAYVYDNKDQAGQQRNVFLNNTKATETAYLNLIEAMEDDAKVGVFSNIMPTADEPIIDVAIGKDYTAIENDAEYFVSDKVSSAEIKFDADANKVILAPIPPKFESAWLDQTDDNEKDIIFTFNDEINLTDLAGFTITVGGESVTPTYKVDGNRLILTLADQPTGDIELNYAKDDGNLKGTNGMPVEDFDFIYEISHATDFEISEPNGDPAQVTESKPEIAGDVATGSTVTVVIKDKDGNVVEDAGGGATVNADGTWLFTPSVDLAVGDYAIEVTATSADGKTAVTKLKRLEVQIEPPTDPVIVGPGGVTDKLISWVKAEESIVLNDENLVSELTDIVGQKSWEVSGSPRSTMSFNALNFNSGLQISRSYFTRTDLEPTVETEREAFSVQVGKSNGFPWEFGGGEEVSSFEKASYGANDQIKTYFGREAIVEAHVAEEYFTNGALLNTWSAMSDWALLLNGKELIAEDNDSTKFISEAQDRKYYIGAGHNSVYNGKITETILFDKQLTQNERNKVNSYLAIKYGITLNNGESEYVDTDEDVVWEVNTTYKNNIAGIARDDAEDLHQKQSQSVNEGVQVAIGLDTLADTNANNLNTLTDKQYLIWADNGSDLTFSKAITGTTEKAHAERIWKVQNTDNVGEVQVAIPANAVDEDTTLLVNDSETFNLSNEKELEEIELNGVNYYGSNVTLTNGQYFTFAAPAPKTTEIEVEEVQATGDKIIVTFDKGVKLTDGTGFTVKIGAEEINLNDLTFEVDSTDPIKLIITLPTGTDVADKDVTVDYDGKGNLTGTNGVPVADFKEEINAVKVMMTEPSEDTVATGKPTFTGTATPGAKVKVKISDEIELTVEADGDGNWSVTPGTTIPDGYYNVEITAEFDGKTSSIVEKDLTIDTNQYVDYSKSNTVTEISDGVTYDDTTGKFKVPSAIREFTFKDGDKDMIATKDADGNWTITEADTSVIVIITQPEANTVTTAKPTFEGTAAPGSTVTVKVSDDITLTTTADANGNWSVTPEVDLLDGNYNIEVTATKDGVTSTEDTKTLTIATVDKTQLEARVDMSTGLTESDYTPESWATYENALGEAEAVLIDPKATQKEVDDAYTALKKAQDTLELRDSTAGVDKSKLQTKVTDVDSLNKDTYTPESWADFEAKQSAAKAVLDNSNATQAEVDQALEDLINAEKALEKKGGLSGLTPSTGKLSPSFKNDVYNYTMNVSNSISEMDFSYGLFDANANVTMTSNGVKVTDGKALLKVGQNTIVIKVEDATGTKTYTITVNRAKASSGGGSGGGGSITPPTTETGEHIPYIKGFPDGEFKPNQNITRNQVALMIARNLGYVDGEKEVTVAPFKDVSLDYHGAGAIALVKELGIMDGDNGNFRGQENITRAQMAKVVARYMELEPKEVEITFTDTANHWSTYYIEAIREAGVIDGYEDNTFKPHNHLSRAHAVKMLNRMFNRGPLNGALKNPFSDSLENHWAFEEIVEAAVPHNYKVDQDGKEWIVK